MAKMNMKTSVGAAAELQRELLRVGWRDVVPRALRGAAAGDLGAGDGPRP